jgi:hypothetical protein
MTQAESIAIYQAMAAVFPDAVVTLVVSVNANAEVTCTGLRTNQSVMRAASRGALNDNIDMGVYVLKSAFDGYDVNALRGRTASVTYKAQDAITQRILGTREHACGGIIVLQLGEYDRVVA